MLSVGVVVGPLGRAEVVDRYVEFVAARCRPNTVLATVSAALTDAAGLWLSTRRGLRAVRAWERDHGALIAGELAAADAELDRTGVAPR